jgi:hypothetical protein
MEATVRAMGQQQAAAAAAAAAAAGAVVADTGLSAPEWWINMYAIYFLSFYFFSSMIAMNIVKVSSRHHAHESGSRTREWVSRTREWVSRTHTQIVPDLDKF